MMPVEAISLLFSMTKNSLNACKNLSHFKSCSRSCQYIDYLITFNCSPHDSQLHAFRDTTVQVYDSKGSAIVKDTSNPVVSNIWYSQ